MEKCRRTKRQLSMSKSWIYSWLWKSSRIRQQSYRSESFAMNTDILTNGPTVKNHISLKTVFEYSATRRTSFRSWFLACQRVLPPVLILQHQWHLQDRKLIILHLPQSSSTSQTTTVLSDSGTRAREDLSGTDSHPVLVSSSLVERTERGDPLLPKPTKNEKKHENHGTERGHPLYSDIPEWLQEFRENLVDDRVPERRDSHASSSHEPSLEPTPTRNVDLGKHSVYTHFPKDRKCEICQRTKITRAPWRRRIGGAVPRAENFGDLITADHKVLGESCESRNNHRYAIVVQDLATQWIQSYPCKTKTFQETQRSLQKFLEPDRKPKVIYTDNSLEFGKACEDLSWNHCTSTPHRSQTNGIAERAVRRVKEGTSAVLLQSGLDENWWADSMECYTYLRNVTDLLSDGRTPYERRFGQPFKGPIIPFGSLVQYYTISAKDQSRIHQFGKKVLPGLFLGYALYAGGIWKGDILVADVEALETMDASEIYSKRLNAKEVIFTKENGKFIFPVADGRIKLPGGDQELRTSTLIRERPIRGESHIDFSWRIRRVSSTTSRLVSGCRWSDEWFLVHVFAAITLNPESNFTRRERNHSLFHWSTLTSPELHIRIWMLSKRNASMIIGISMGLETCLILGQVSHNLLYWKKNLLKDICGPGGD